MIGKIRVYTLYEPDDVAAAYGDWRCNCGPAALAAVLRIPCMTVRPLFPLFPAKAWCNPTHMQTALGLTRVVWSKCKPGVWPLAYGLCFLQIEGPWENPGVPIGVAYRHTHWIGFSQNPSGERSVYDVNADAWLPWEEWEAEIMALILQSKEHATGWRLRAAIEVQP